MTKMSFAQRIDVWRTLTARPADLADEVPGLAELRGELRGELATILDPQHVPAPAQPGPGRRE
jgi:hypothetical protein